MATATYSVLVGWETVPANAFTLNASQLNSSKVLASQFSDQLDVFQFGLSTFDGTDTFADPFSALFSDVSADVKSVAIRRGRTDNLDSFGAGEATVVFHDPTGEYNPLNESSPLYPYVIPGRPIKVEATFNGANKGLFRGFVRSIEHDPSPGVKETRINCQDLFLYLDRARPTITALSSPTTVGTIIGKVLDAIDWTNAALRSLASGDTINAAWSANGSSTGLSLIQELLETDRGGFYHRADGVVVYEDRYARSRRTSSATLTGVSTSAAPATDLTNIKNRATVTKTGSGSQTASDLVSISNYGASDYSPIESAYLNSPAQALSLAQWLVTQGKDPTPPVRSLVFSACSSDALMTQAISRELNDVVTVNDLSTGSVAKRFYIEGVEHSITAAGRSHEVKYALSPVSPQSPIMFGTSRVVNGEFSSPTTSSSPYTAADTSADVFAF